MRAIQGGKGRDVEDGAERRRLLGLIHIAKKDLGMHEEEYRSCLKVSYGVPTAAALTNEELRGVVRFFITQYDWRPRGSKMEASKSHVAEMLQHRIYQFIPQIPGGERRVLALCRKFCGIDRIEWCKDPSKLKQLLAIMGNIKRKEVKNIDGSTTGPTRP